MILIIGYGFLGGAIYDSLKLKKKTVKVISRSFPDNTNPDFIQGEIHEIPHLLKDIKNVNTIIHCVHTTVPANSMDDNIYDVQSNVLPFIQLMTECQKKEVENFIYISSGGAVYGNPFNSLPITEQHPTNPISSYGITKLTCEKYLLLNKSFFIGNCVILRPSNIFGFGQKINKPQGLIGHVQDSIINSKHIEVWGDGNSKKDYLYLDDFVYGVMSVVFCNIKLPNNIYNISSGNLYSINNLIHLFEKKYQKQASVIYNTHKKFDVLNIALNSELFKKTFEWNRNTKVEDFIERISF
jgi:UDP-glucose 4-epimerase